MNTHPTHSPAPHQYPRRVLLMVIGSTPQVVTETVYALSVTRKPAFNPTEIHLITTEDGARDARLALLHSDLHWYDRLCEDYGLTKATFDEDTIHVIHGPEGAALRDIRTAQDNEAAADLITEKVRRFTSDPDSSLHVYPSRMGFPVSEVRAWCSPSRRTDES